MKINLPKLKKPSIKIPKGKKLIIQIGTFLGIIATILISFYSFKYITNLQRNYSELKNEKENNLAKLERIGKELDELKNEDQYEINQELKENIENIEKTYNAAISTYEELLKLKEQTDKTEKYDEKFTKALVYLAELNYQNASKALSSLHSGISSERDKIAAAYTIPQNVPTKNEPPGSGYSRQQVQTDAGTFMVSLVAADITSTKIIVDTASEGNCGNDCPVLPLAEYVSRNGAYAGVNGSYFCPATYPSCAGKTNTFDLLVMNKNKTYFNSDNNVYSSNPAVIFGDGYIRFVMQASEWGRDTSPSGVLSNFPMLVFNSEIKFGGDDDPKKDSKGSRSFVAKKGSTAYIGVVHNVTVAESARVMKAMGMENAMNLDDGGSTALWSGSYKVGPGRSLPNVILFVGK